MKALAVEDLRLWTAISIVVRRAVEGFAADLKAEKAGEAMKRHTEWTKRYRRTYRTHFYSVACQGCNSTIYVCTNEETPNYCGYCRHPQSKLQHLQAHAAAVLEAFNEEGSRAA